MRLEIDFGFCHVAQVEVGVEYAFFHKAEAALVAFVEVNGANKRLHGIAKDVAVVALRLLRPLHHLRQPEAFAHAVEALALHNLRAGGG